MLPRPRAFGPPSGPQMESGATRRHGFWKNLLSNPGRIMGTSLDAEAAAPGPILPPMPNVYWSWRGRETNLSRIHPQMRARRKSLDAHS